MKKLLLMIIPLLALAGCTKTNYEVILPKGIDIISVGSEFTDNGCSVWDKTDEYEMGISSSNLDVNTIGTYKVVYKIIIEGKSFTCARVIEVIDSTPPTVTLNPGIDTILVNGTFVDAYVDVSDNLDQSPTVAVISTVNSSEVGDYTVTYIVTDSSMNETVIVRNVHIIN